MHEMSVTEEIEAAIIRAYDEGWTRLQIKQTVSEYLREYEEVSND